MLTRRIVPVGPRFGPPRTTAFGDDLFELRLNGQEGIACVFFCALIGRRIVVLHALVEKSQKTPAREMGNARRRTMEIKHANA